MFINYVPTPATVLVPMHHHDINESMQLERSGLLREVHHFDRATFICFSESLLCQL